MSSRRLFLLALAIVAVGAVLVWFFLSRPPGLEAGAIDLIASFPEAEKRTTMPSLEDAFAIQTVTIARDTRLSIFAHPFSRITWTLTVPPHAVLRTAVGVREDTWNTQGDGGLFRIGVSEGETYKEFYKQRVNPQQKPEDRRWFPVEIDLSAYAGHSVRIIFNTEPGESGNAVADACVWGMPRIVAVQ